MKPIIPQKRKNSDFPLAMLERAEVVTVGTVNVDLIMGPQEPWPTPGTEVILPNASLREGGGAGITAMALAALGCRQRMIVNVGQDLFGDWLRQRYGGLSQDWIVEDVDTALTVGITHPDGERTFLSTPGHVAVFKPEDVMDRLKGMGLDEVIVLFVGTSLMPALAPGLPEIFRYVRARGGLVALDTAWPTGGWTEELRREVFGWLGEVSILLLNEIEAEGLLGDVKADGLPDVSRALYQMPEGAVFVTKLGDRGARIDRLGAEPLSVDAAMVQPVDTIGAGDSFNAGFLAALARGLPMEACLELAVRTASIAISSDPRRYPNAEEIGLDQGVAGKFSEEDALA
ncbi:carbohydrate kinase family protein [Aestuariispira insulae]|uniref:Carbohydrate kinase PfkB domain-containing protein n=1 Tax=Aestuariispira insulae TaxID=1461337 RepID=A0A3D9H9C3_9PROT|nr:PfkB family carbohydrate kinase [Aestuariispira insulae]RED46102.1 hypothetical protein DFP90_11010 [Aestuariispira insulae]